LPPTASPPLATITPAPSAFRVAVRAPDGSVQYADISARVNVGAGLPLYGYGLLSPSGSDGSVIYAITSGAETRVVALDAAGERPLDFIQSPGFGLAVWPGTEAQPSRLAWTTGTTGAAPVSTLIFSAPDGSGETIAVEQAIDEEQSHLLALRWSWDGQFLYFSQEPFGLGGYILFGGASSLYAYRVDDKRVSERIPFDGHGGRFICLDDLSASERWVADHCTPRVITVRDLSNGQAAEIQPPSAMTDFGQMGSARFSPDGSRVAYALALSNPDSEQGWVAVSDGLSGPSNLIVASPPGDYWTVLTWLDAENLLLQAHGAMPGVYQVKADGQDLIRLADGTFLALVGSGR
jgi:outer membrane protein assembly factor BamB